MKSRIIATLLCVSAANIVLAAEPSKPQMKYMGEFDAGQPNVSIYKLFDPTEDVVCYMLSPKVVGKKDIGNGNFIYDGNSVGSISCVKAKMAVVPVSQNQQVTVKK